MMVVVGDVDAPHACRHDHLCAYRHCDLHATRAAEDDS